MSEAEAFTVAVPYAPVLGLIGIVTVEGEKLKLLIWIGVAETP